MQYSFFYAFIQIWFEYSSSVLFSASNFHLKLLDCALNNINSFFRTSLSTLKNRNIALFCMLYKIIHNCDHPTHCKLPQFTKSILFTLHIILQNDRALVLARYITYQFSLCFIYSTTQLWNSLPNETVLAVKQDCFIALVKIFC